MTAIRRAKDLYPKINSFTELMALARRNGRFVEFVSRDEPVVAIINAGRWGAFCLGCNNFMLCDPDWPQAVCVACGNVYEPVFPESPDREHAELALEKRREANQNWEPHRETVASLHADNHEHGIHAEVHD